MKKPLLLLNGYAATGADWDPAFLTGLEQGFEVIHPDNRGTGDVPLGDPQLTIEGLAADMADLLDRRRIDRVVLAGWSMGGFVAQELAARAPERVESLVLLATDQGGPDALRGGPEAIARLFDHGGTPREQATRLIRLLFPPALATRVDAEAGQLVAAARAALSPAALFAEEGAMERWYVGPADERLAAIEAPALVMAGELDEVIPVANSTLLAAALADSRLRTFDGAGHAFIAQEAAAASAAIRDFALGR